MIQILCFMCLNMCDFLVTEWVYFMLIYDGDFPFRYKKLVVDDTRKQVTDKCNLKSIIIKSTAVLYAR